MYTEGLFQAGADLNWAHILPLPSEPLSLLVALCHVPPLPVPQMSPELACCTADSGPRCDSKPHPLCPPLPRHLPPATPKPPRTCRQPCRSHAHCPVCLPLGQFLRMCLSPPDPVTSLGSLPGFLPAEAQGLSSKPMDLEMGNADSRARHHPIFEFRRLGSGYTEVDSSRCLEYFVAPSTRAVLLKL